MAIAVVLLVLVGACQGGTTASSVPGTAAPTGQLATQESPWDWVAIETVAPVSAAPSPGCDEVDRLFVAMFVGLSAAALSNAGIERQDFLDALHGDRAALKQYLLRLGIYADDAQVDALMSTDLADLLLGTGAIPSGDVLAAGPWAGCE